MTSLGVEVGERGPGRRHRDEFAVSLGDVAGGAHDQPLRGQPAARVRDAYALTLEHLPVTPCRG